MAQRMYQCEICKKTTEPNVPVNRAVIKTRPKSYNQRWLICHKKQKPELYIVPLGTLFEPPSQKIQQQRRERWICIDRGGNGFETVREINLCTTCAKKETM